MNEKLNLFERFGGTRKMAEALGEAPSTVQSWKTSGRVPAGRQPKVLETARELGITVTAEDIIFPLGRDDTPESDSGSATKTAENICDPNPVADKIGENIRDHDQVIESKAEADSHAVPFPEAPAASGRSDHSSAASPSTCSPTAALQPMPAARPTSSTCSTSAPRRADPFSNSRPDAA